MTDILITAPAPTVAVVYGGSPATQAVAATVMTRLRPDATVVDVQTGTADPFADVSGQFGPLTGRPALVVSVGRVDPVAVALGVLSDAPVLLVRGPGAMPSLVDVAQLAAEIRPATVLNVAVEGARRLTTGSVLVTSAGDVPGWCRDCGSDYIVTSDRFRVLPTVGGAVLMIAEGDAVPVQRLRLQSDGEPLHVDVDGRTRAALSVQIDVLPAALRLVEVR